MSNFWRVFLISFLCTSIFSEDLWRAPAREARKKNPIKSTKESKEDGKKLFMMACAACHGETGKGNGPAAIALERNGKRICPADLNNPLLKMQTDGELFWKISNGNSPMPAFQETLTEEQRWKVVIFIRGLEH